MAAMMSPGSGSTSASTDEVNVERVIKLIQSKKNLRPQMADKKIKNLLVTEFEDGDRAYFLIQNKDAEASYELLFEFKLALYEVPEEDQGDDANQMTVHLEPSSQALKWLNPKAKKAGGKAARGGLGAMGGMGGMGALMAEYEIAERSFKPYKVKVTTEE